MRFERIVAVAAFGFSFFLFGPTIVRAESSTVEWIRQFGTSSVDVAEGISVGDGGNIYVTGRTGGNLDGANVGGDDAFLIKYDASGAVLWTRQLGTSSADKAFGVSVDTGGNAYITGYTEGSVGGANAGGWDGFLTKYNGSGVELWSTLLGTTSTEEAFGISVDVGGIAYITGWTGGSFGGPNAGSDDAFIAKITTPEPVSCVLLILGGTLFLRRRKR